MSVEQLHMSVSFGITSFFLNLHGLSTFMTVDFFYGTLWSHAGTTHQFG